MHGPCRLSSERERPATTPTGEADEDELGTVWESQCATQLGMNRDVLPPCTKIAGPLGRAQHLIGLDQHPCGDVGSQPAGAAWLAG